MQSSQSFAFRPVSIDKMRRALDFDKSQSNYKRAPILEWFVIPISGSAGRRATAQQ